MSDSRAAALAPLLTTRRLGRVFEALSSCGSTNDEVAARAASAEEGLLVVADEQTGGRGRRGRAWHSPPGESLFCSLLLRPALPAHRVAPLTLLAGAALARALAALGFSPRLKWPNDVLLDAGEGPRKVAGILTEMASEGERVRHVVLGIGINVNAESFPGALAQIATSLRLVRHDAVERDAVLAAFLNTFEPIYDHWLAVGPAAGVAEWRRHAALGQRCWWSRGGQRIEGVATGVSESGALRVRIDGDHTVAVHAGEVNWVGTG